MEPTLKKFRGKKELKKKIWGQKGAKKIFLKARKKMVKSFLYRKIMRHDHKFTAN